MKKFLFSLLMVAGAIAHAQANEKTLSCDAPVGASSGIQLRLPARSQAGVVAQSGKDWLILARREDVSVFVTLISVRKMNEDSYASDNYIWERIQFHLDVRYPDFADTTFTKLENRPIAPLDSRLLEYGRYKASRVQCRML
jgi:hypothetical protein